MSTGFRAITGVLPKPRPIKAETPVPKIASASPAAYWFVRNVSASTPKMSEASAPPMIAARMASGIGNPANEVQTPTSRADQHHPLDPEIEHAGFFDHQLAERGENQWCRRYHGTGDDRYEQVHQATPLAK